MRTNCNNERNYRIVFIVIYENNYFFYVNVTKELKIKNEKFIRYFFNLLIYILLIKVQLADVTLTR